ncbi:MAG: hypothetical protein AB7O48_18070 [Cyclobacteriaceae bacterium]
MNKLLIVVVFFGALISCKQQDKKVGDDTPHPLAGEWRNVDLTVEYDKKNGQTTRVFAVDENTWEDSLQIRPIRTYFKSDGTFNSEHFDLNDSLILDPSGTWLIENDMITMITTKPFSDTTACEYKINGDVVTFGCWVDWDQDGSKDDWYLGTQKRFAPAKTDN